jgi:phosphatidylglycerophosphatase C
MKKKIYCFDFDGTLTTSDTLLEFIKYAKGTSRFLMVFLKYSPLLVLMKLHLYPNWKAKQQIFAHLFAGMRIEKFDALCRGFAEESQHLLRPKGITLMHEALVAGAQVFIVSASIDNWVRPFFDIRNLKGVQVLGTQIEVEDGKLTGRFKSNNCYGKEKVHRITEALKSFERSEYEIEAFGDSRGDKEMLAFADKGHFKPFRE